MLGHFQSRPRRDERRSGGNVERVLAVSTRTHGVHHLAFHVHLERFLPHDRGHTRNLFYRLSFDPQCGEKRPQLAWRGVSLHYLPHYGGRHIHIQGTSGDHGANGFTNHS